MTICRYFQQGNCKFGNRCRFEHVYANYGGGGGGSGHGGYRGGVNNYNTYHYHNPHGSGGGGYGGGGGNDRGGTSILRLRSSGQYQQPNSIFSQNLANRTAGQFSSTVFNDNTSHVRPEIRQDIKEFMQGINVELMVAERGGQWFLSCFSPFKDQCCLPGFEDHSPEELRWHMYQARQMGKLEECERQIKELYGKAKLSRQQLLNPTPEILEIITRLARGEKIETSSPFGKPTENINGFGSNTGRSILSIPSASTNFSFTLENKNTPNQGFSQVGNVAPTSMVTEPFFNESCQSLNQNIFGGSQQAAPVQSFGGMTAMTPKTGLLGAAPSSIDDYVTYTPLKDLSEEVKNAFIVPKFTMGSVPTKPPPKELCG